MGKPKGAFNHSRYINRFFKNLVAQYELSNIAFLPYERDGPLCGGMSSHVYIDPYVAHMDQ